MPPEQARGQSDLVGPASDVYGLGATFYELLTGRNLFQAASVSDMLVLIAKSNPQPPTKLQPQMPSDLEDICMKCLEKEPGRRYQTAASLPEDLRRFLNGMTVTHQDRLSPL